MQIISKIYLDFGRSTLPITVFAKQYDQESRYVEIVPLNSGQPYALESGTVARLQVTKADGTQVINEATIDGGEIYAELTAQALAAEGVAVAEIGLYKNSSLLTSQSFYIDVKATAYDTDKVQSSNEFKSLIEAFNAVDNLNAWVEATPTGATIYITDKEGVTHSAHIDTLNAISGWSDIMYAVRSGLGATLFPVGWEFETLDSDTGLTLVWVVCDHNKHTAVSGKLSYTMTIRLKTVYSNANGDYKSLVFDAAEALYYCSEALAAGTYNFIWNYDTGSVVSGTYQFTLTQGVPAGGQIVISGSSNGTALTARTIATYASVGDTAAIESGLAITSGSDGTNLGTANNTSSTSENLNCAQRVIFGSNNYAQSAARQWLNSANAAGLVWSPTNKFDRAPSWAATYNGFMHGLPADFLAAVQTAAIPCRTNSVFEVASLDGTEFTTNTVYTLNDKFFLLSHPELYGTYDSTAVKDGEQLELFEGLSNTERIERDAAGSARYSWQRSPHPSYATNERFVNADGSLSHNGAINARGAAPACIIA